MGEPKLIHVYGRRITKKEILTDIVIACEDDRFPGFEIPLNKKEQANGEFSDIILGIAANKGYPPLRQMHNCHTIPRRYGFRFTLDVPESYAQATKGCTGYVVTIDDNENANNIAYVKYVETFTPPGKKRKITVTHEIYRLSEHQIPKNVRHLFD